MSLTRFFDHFNGFGNNILMHTGRIFEVNPIVVGVSPNFLETTFADEFVETLESSDTGLDVIQELYTPRGS